jgi:hypothetical protein
MRKYLLLTGFFFFGTIFFFWTLYKNKDIEFVDAVVESVIEKTGVKSKFVAAKIERKAKEEIAKLESLKEETEKALVLPESKLDSAEAVALEKEKRIEETANKVKKELTDGLVTVGVKLEKLEKEEVKEKTETLAKPVEEVDEMLEGLIVAKQTNEKKSDSDKVINVKTFTAKANQNYVLKNEGSVSFIVENGFSHKGELFQADQVFFAKVNVFDGKAFFNVDQVDDIPVKFESYNKQDNSRGYSLDLFYKNPKGDRILAEGSTVVFSLQ